jgi:hypothetical protein
VSLAAEYSGIVINQNQVPGDNDALDIADNAWRYQEAALPSNYVRGTDATEQIIPRLSGWSVLVDVADGQATEATLDWTIQYQVFGIGWITAASGTTIGAPADGRKVWFDVYVDNPVPVNNEMLSNRIRFGFRAPVDPGLDPIEGTYDGSLAIVGAESYSVRLIPGVPYPTQHGGYDGFLYEHPSNRTLTWYPKRGINRIWFANPNPLAQTFSQAYAADGTTPLDPAGISVNFRVLGLTADEGVDFLGNNYRAAVVSLTINNTDALDSAAQDKSWLSKPNPSRFAVESLYYNTTQPDGTGRVIDNVLVDPETPGVYFSVYYSNEDGVPTTEAEWENKLWIRVPANFRALIRERHTLPAPIIAKFVKVEFTHLQARSYSPGDFAKPVSYKKHPKWVLDYFLARLDADKARQEITGSSVAVIYDALQLAYDYYVDDLHTSANQPVEIDSSYRQTVQSFINARDDFSDQVDPQALAQINLVMDPYRSHPATFSKDNYLLGVYAQANANALTYPTERTALTGVPTTDVNALRNAAVIYENDYPVMFFFITCRHKYREIVAPLETDKAYFVGIKQIAFTRERYDVATDTEQYIEPAGDLTNMERNDFINDEGLLRV